MLSRNACAALAPFVGKLWVSDDQRTTHARELVLPTGFAYLVIRVWGDGPRVGADALSPAVIGGARAGHYTRSLSERARVVGVELYPGAAQWLFGTPANLLADAHTPLECVWTPHEVERVRDQLASQPTPHGQLDALEGILLARSPRVQELHPAVACALAELRVRDVGSVVHDSGYSHRGFNNLFSASVGLTPKRFVRVMRFASALERVHGADEQSLARLALASGYSDQAHFTREFREFAGVTPARYRALSPRFAHHLPLEFNSVQDR